MSQDGRWRTLATVAFASVASLASGSDSTVPPASRLDVRLDPAGGTIGVTAEIRSPGSSTFSLARDLKVRRVEADGKVVAFREAPSPSGEASREVTLAVPAPERLVIEYAGPIRADSYPKVISQVNGIGPRWVELAGYVGWYPRATGSGSFTFRLSVDVPAGFVTVTNGRLVREEPATGGRSRTEWESYEPTGDIVLVSAPGLRRTAIDRGGVSIEIFSAALPPDYLEPMKEDLGRSVDSLARIVGAPSPTRVVRVVYSPRPGWGYVRTPLIVVSEESALAGRSQKFGRARDLRYVVHEVAHYWWHMADTGTPEDWLNEGLAEYSAFLVAGELVGREFADLLLEEYRERSATSATTAAIAETENWSPDREVNRYARPVLLLEEARRKYGSDRLTAFLQALYRRFTGAGPATTAAFLEEAEKSLGREAKETFSEALLRKQWADAAAQAYAYSPKDAAFLGTWTGSLTQAGATHEVVLHLVLSDGTLVATLDSPDQGARDIPVPVVRITGDTLYFALGAFGVSYRGVLKTGERAIRGEWKQGGLTFPLELTTKNASGR